MKYFLILILILPYAGLAQFPPPAGQTGTTAIYKDSTIIVSWASSCSVARGWQNIADTTLGRADVGDSSMATGQAGTNGVVSLGDGGYATLTFPNPITNGSSWDFAVFENGFTDTFLELAFVEVSSDGILFYRFPSTSLTDTLVQVEAYGGLDAAKLNNLAGKYRMFYGTPFDLEELKDSVELDINHITHVRIRDVVGSLDNNYATYDSHGNKINDPWPTPFNSSGFDLDAVGVINQIASVKENDNNTNLSFYPNPCRNTITINYNDISSGAILSILNLSGMCIKQQKIVEQTILINISDITPGIYLLRLASEKQTIYKKLIKL